METMVSYMKKAYGIVNILKLNGLQTDLLRASIAEDIINDINYNSNFKEWQRRYNSVENLMYEKYGEY